MMLSDPNPAMMLLLGLMGLFAVIAIPAWVIGSIVWVVRWCLAKEDCECGWGTWFNHNPSGWCSRRKFHFGTHQWPRPAVRRTEKTKAMECPK